MSQKPSRWLTRLSHAARRTSPLWASGLFLAGQAAAGDLGGRPALAARPTTHAAPGILVPVQATDRPASPAPAAAPATLPPPTPIHAEEAHPSLPISLDTVLRLA